MGLMHLIASMMRNVSSFPMLTFGEVTTPCRLKSVVRLAYSATFFVVHARLEELKSIKEVTWVSCLCFR